MLRQAAPLTLPPCCEQRKFIIGEANGSVRVYNYANGAVMKSMVSHTREVRSGCMW